MSDQWDGVKFTDMTKEQLLATCIELHGLLEEAVEQNEKLNAQFKELADLSTMDMRAQ